MQLNLISGDDLAMSQQQRAGSEGGERERESDADKSCWLNALYD
jgi:hypothetical protein